MNKKNVVLCFTIRAPPEQLVYFEETTIECCRKLEASLSFSELHMDFFSFQFSDNTSTKGLM